MVAEIAGIPHLNQSLSAHKSTSRQLKLMDIFYLNRLEFSVELPLNLNVAKEFIYWIGPKERLVEFLTRPTSSSDPIC